MPLFPFFSRPPSKTPWGTGGASNDPSDGERNLGFLQSATVGAGRLNSLLKELATGMRYFLQRGLPDWVNDDSYPQYALVRDPFDGQIYYATGVPVDATAPHSDAPHWTPIFPPPGAVLRTSLITATGASTLAKAPGCKRALAHVFGGGGGGGGTPLQSASPGTTVAIGSGGASGGYGLHETTNIPATWNFNVGVGGTGVVGLDGNAGGNTTLQDSAVTVTAFGGPAGKTSGTQPIGASIDGGAAPATSTNASKYNGTGKSGAPGWITLGGGSNGLSLSGEGGSVAPWGYGGQAKVEATNGPTAGAGDGNPGNGHASGGGGALVFASIFAPQPAYKGGDGTGGLILLIEMS